MNSDRGKHPIGAITGIILVLLPGTIVVALGVEQPALVLAVEVLTIAMAWLVLRLDGRRWSDVGLRRPTSPARTAVVALGATAGIIVLTSPLQSLVRRVTGETPDLGAFAVLEGNLGALIAGLLVVWTIAAFGEELLFRGFLIDAIQRVLPDSIGDSSWVLALVISSIIFGAGHAYQGPAGMILTGIIGLLFGVLYLTNRRNLWPAILTHGLYDTIGFIAVYAGVAHL